MSPPSPYLTCFYLVLMLHINICSLFIQDIYLRVSFLTIKDNVWFRFEGDVYGFLSFCFVLFCCVKKKKKKSFTQLEVYVLSLLYYSCLKSSIRRRRRHTLMNFIAFMLNSLHMHVATQTQLVVEGKSDQKILRITMWRL